MSGSETRAPRAGEELDLGALTRFLDDKLPGVTGAIEVSQFPGGHSNLTYLIRRGGQEFVLRRPPVGSKVKSAHDMGREVRVLSALAPVLSSAPKPLAYCDDVSVLGAPFYVMERRSGVILRKELPRGMTLVPATARHLCEQLIDALVALHVVDYRAAGLAEFGKPEGYIERQVRGWTERYDGSRTDELTVVTEVAAWLASNRPADGAPALIHNDFKFDNAIFDEGLTHVTGILDWEMATVGDPRMDLGTALGYWVDATDPQPLQMMRFGPTTLPGMMTRSEVAARYMEASGTDVGNVVFFYAFGLFKTAVVAQQIYYRYKQGLTKDPRFAPFIHAVRALCEQAAVSIARGTIGA